MSYLEHFNDPARAVSALSKHPFLSDIDRRLISLYSPHQDLHLISHTRRGCKCKGDGVHGAFSAAQEEPTASSTQPSKRLRMSIAEPMQSLSLCKSFYLHEVYLVSSSKFFRTLLETAVGGLKTEMSTVGKPRTITILHDYIEEGEMEAVELVFKSFYDKGEPPLDTIPSEIDANVPILLKALMVADRYQADNSKEKILKVLASVSLSGSWAKNLTLEVAKSLYALSSIINRGELHEIKHGIQIQFYKEMNFNYEETINEPQMLDAFLALPYSSVLQWIKRDDLKVHSENDVVYLLNKWIEISEPSDDEVWHLIWNIRVINLGPTYLHLLHSLEWFDQYDSEVKLLTSYRTMNAANLDLLCDRMDLPIFWLSAPRKTTL